MLLFFLLGVKRTMGAMGKVIVSLILMTLLSGGDGLFRSLYKNFKLLASQGEDVGEPMFLTPYIATGKLEDGKFYGIVHPLFLLWWSSQEVTCQVLVFAHTWLQCN